MKRWPQLVVVGSSNMDIVVNVPHLPSPGETIVGGDMLMTPGGKGANQAAAAARLGADVSLIAHLGGDAFGEHCDEILLNFGISLDYVVRDPGVPSGVAMITVDDKGQNSIVVSPGANYRLLPEDIDRARSVMQQADLIVCQFEVTHAVVKHTIETARKLERPILINPAPVNAVPLDEYWYRQIDILVPNQVEAGQLLNRDVEGITQAEQAARDLYARGVGLVIVTLGEDGAVAVGKGGTVHVPAFEVDVVDTTAAGDCFVGAFATAWGRNHDLEAALRFANAAASLAVTRKGAQRSLPLPQEVDALLGSVN